MATNIKKTSRNKTSDGFAYLTKWVLISKERIAGKIAAKNAMVIMGYVVTVRDGWVVKEHQDGRVEQIEEI